MDFKNTMDYYEQLYAHKLDNTDETGYFFDGYSLPTLTKRTDNLNRPIFIKESEPIKFPGEFYQIFKEEIIPILYNPFQRREADGILFKLFNYPNSKTRQHYKKTIDQHLS